jgi:hypothetical protein
MFSHEIEQTITSQNYHIDSETYFKICSSSPQIWHIKYNPYSNEYEMWSSDNYYWKFTMFRKDN